MNSPFTMEFVTVTPKMASGWLDTCNKANRNISKTKARQYATDIKNGKWQVSPEGISFDKKGNLVNGQHRLYGIILANTSVMMAVFRGVDATIFDKGRNRTTSNTMAMQGIDPSIANKYVVSAINYLFIEAAHTNSVHLTDAQIILFAEDNKENLAKVRSIVGSGAKYGICDNAVCHAAVFCALYNGLSEEVLRRFFKIVNTGFYDYKEETAAIVFKNYVLKNKGNGNLMSSRHELFSQCLSAINGFVTHTPRAMAYQILETPPFFSPVKDYIKNNFI